jgi:hypothetical protein
MTDGALKSKSKATALRFRRQQDAFDFADHCVKNVRDWFVSHRLDFVERYRNQELDIVIKLHSRRGMGKRDLIIRAIPMRGMKDRDGTASAVNAESAADHTERRKQSMLVRVAQLIERPKQAIPSFVWLEPAKQRQDFRRQIFGTSASYSVLQSGGIVTKRKKRTPGVGLSRNNSGGISCLVENGAKRLNSFGCGINTSHGDWALEPHLVHQGIYVHLSDTFVGVFCTPGFEALFQPPKVLLCPFQASLGAVKGITSRGSHDNRIRSDQRAEFSESSAEVPADASKAA